jgi:hypothetical protein
VANPNANVAAGGGTVATLLVWILGREHVSLSAEDGSILAGVFSSAVLFLGRNGLRGVWRRLIDGPTKEDKPDG